MNPLGDIIALLRPHAAFSKPITGRGDWGVRYTAHDAPSFCVVLEGRCWLALDRAAPLRLEAGDFLLLSVTPPFALYSQPGVPCTLRSPSRTALRHGEPRGRPDFRMLGGTFQTEPVNGSLLLGLLPRVMHIRSARSDTDRLSRLVGLIMEECAEDRPAREMVLERLLEILLVESLRSYSHGAERLPAGLLAGLRDPALARALRAMHGRVSHEWTVASLASHVGMSRSAFAASFATTVGCAPMEYLARWRMTLAQDALSRGGRSLDQLALDIGFQSASAFSTAFRRRIGCAPGAFAKARRQMVSA